MYVVVYFILLLIRILTNSQFNTEHHVSLQRFASLSFSDQHLTDYQPTRQITQRLDNSANPALMWTLQNCAMFASTGLPAYSVAKLTYKIG